MIIIRKEEAVTTEWSGGTTTQLAIWPAGAVYADRDFLWRLSTAVVNDEKSTFTPLPDYTRFITTREGDLRLRHDDGDWYDLSPGDVSEFDGGSLTESEGRVTDFNLMLRKGKVEGTMDTEFLEDGESLHIVIAGDDGEAVSHGERSEAKKEGSFTAVYLSEGKGLTVECDGKAAAELSEGDLLIFEDVDRAGKLTVAAAGDVYLIRTDMELL